MAMEWWLIGLGVFVALTLLNTERQAGGIRRDLARVDRKLNLLLKEMNISFEEVGGLSDRVKELARDPSRKIEAIKAYREETGAGLAEAKQTVEAFIDSLER
jgi:hypothetical protein